MSEETITEEERIESAFVRPLRDEPLAITVTSTEQRRRKTVAAPNLWTLELPTEGFQAWVDSMVEKEIQEELRYGTPHFCVRGYNYGCRGLLCRTADVLNRGKNSGYTSLMQPIVLAGIKDFLDRHPYASNIAQPSRSRGNQ